MKRKINDERVVAIINDPLLPGREKMRLISERLKSRKTIQVQTKIVSVEKPHSMRNAWIPDGYDNDGIQMYIGVDHCTDCKVAVMTTSATKHIDDAPHITRAEIRLTTGELGVCGGGNG